MPPGSCARWPRRAFSPSSSASQSPGARGRGDRGRLGSPPDGLLRLAALAVLTVEDAARCAERLRLSNAEGERLRRAAVALARLHGLAAAPTDAALRRSAVRLRSPRRAAALLLAQAEFGGRSRRRGLFRRPPLSRRNAGAGLAAQGRSITARGVAPGPRVGGSSGPSTALGRAGFPVERGAVDACCAPPRRPRRRARAARI